MIVRRARRRLRRDESGAATVEFVILFPLFIALVFAVFESGWLMTRYMMLDRGVDITVRELRLGKYNNPDHATIKDQICEYAMIIRDCRSTLKVQLIELDVSDPPRRSDVECHDRGVATHLQIASTYQSAATARSSLTFLRACVLVDPIMPGLGFGLLLPQHPSGGHQMVSMTAFKNEPE